LFKRFTLGRGFDPSKAECESSVVPVESFQSNDAFESFERFEGSFVKSGREGWLCSRSSIIVQTDVRWRQRS